MVARNVATTRSSGTEQQQWVADSCVWIEASLLQPRANGVWFLCELQGALEATLPRIACSAIEALFTLDLPMAVGTRPPQGPKSFSLQKIHISVFKMISATRESF